MLRIKTGYDPVRAHELPLYFEAVLGKMNIIKNTIHNKVWFGIRYYNGRCNENIYKRIVDVALGKHVFTWKKPNDTPSP